MLSSRLLLAGSLWLAARASAFAQSLPDVEFGGYVQSQYERIATGGDSRDRVIFRRIYVSVDAGLADHWVGVLQADLSPATRGDRVRIRDAFLRYTGFEDHGILISLGNQKMPFSRSLLTSGSRRGLVERPRTGERPFGAPGRSIGVKVDGRNGPGSFQWSGALASALHAPATSDLLIAGIADSEDEWNEGLLLSGRAEWHPLGPVPLEQGSFVSQPLRFTVAAGTYWWRNDNDRNLHTADGVSTSQELADLRDSLGLELSAALRVKRLSIDAEWHRVTGETIDPRLTAGLYRAGHARLLKSAIEAGYMMVAERVELLAAIDVLDVQARAARSWRPVLGANWYVARHRLKFQFMHRESFNDDGFEGIRVHTTYAQAQYVF